MFDILDHLQVEIKKNVNALKESMTKRLNENEFIENIENIACIVASHNEESNLLAVQLMEKMGLPSNHPHLHFSQLYGMSDHISFNLANSIMAIARRMWE